MTGAAATGVATKVIGVGVKVHGKKSPRSFPRTLVKEATFNAPEAFFDAYVEAALFTETDDADQPLDKNYTAADIDANSLSAMKGDCAAYDSSVRCMGPHLMYARAPYSAPPPVPHSLLTTHASVVRRSRSL